MKQGTHSRPLAAMLPLAAMVLTATVLLPVSLTAQSYRSSVNDGNDEYRAERYDKAQELYERAAVEDPERMESFFNLGNSAYRSGDAKTALENYERAGRNIRSKGELEQTLYNAGNTFLDAAEKADENPAAQQAEGGEDLKTQGYQKAIELYKQALKIDPNDEDARYNLTYARKKLEDQKQKDKNQDKDDKQKKKQKDEKDKDDKSKDKDKEKKDDKKDKKDENQQQKKKQNPDSKDEQKPQPKPDKQKSMSKQQAEQILNALEREEKDLQKKKRQKVNARVKVEKDW